MQIKDIVNHTVATIDNCASEPIHIPGSIQPHGCLLAVHRDQFTITYCSANTATWLGQEPVALLGSSLKELYPALCAGLEGLLSSAEEQVVFEWQLNNEQHLTILVHESGDQLIIEFEKAPEQHLNSQELYNNTVEFIAQIDRAGSLQQLSQQIAEQTRKITGYDRVMIYTFDKEYNGRVTAEARADGMEPFLDLHYPHTDIPPQARELYLRNLTRIIADVNYTPIPLLTIDDGKHEHLDLSRSALRSVSPIHIQYLKNMQVGGSLSISLLLDGRLWGLIACHHRTPLLLTHYQRQAALLQGYFLSSQIRVRQVAEEYEVNVACEAHLQQLLNKIDQEEDFALKFIQFTSLLGVANAGGVVIMLNGELFEKGIVPPPDQTRQLIAWLAANIASVQYTTSFLKSKYPDAEKISRFAAGIIYHTLGKASENCVIWFRPEVERTVKWAGNPQEAVKKEPIKNMLTPRTSFAIWKERVRWHSTEWRVSEINAASRFASTLQNYFHMIYLRNEEARQRMLNEKLRKANEELANINWITSHDLKEPIRKIHLFASKVLDEKEAHLSELILNSVNKIQQSAQRMRVLVDDILHYSIVTNEDEQYQSTELAQLLQELYEELKNDPENIPIRLTFDALPTIHGIRFQLRQLFENLLKNAVKFRKTNEPAVIHVSCQEISGEDTGEDLLDINRNYYKITIKDEGIGFNAAQKEKIFQIFFRLHNKEIYPGTGMGLAISRKIAENHGGAIMADAAEGQGAAFILYLPVQPIHVNI